MDWSVYCIPIVDEGYFVAGTENDGVAACSPIDFPSISIVISLFQASALSSSFLFLAQWLRRVHGGVLSGVLST